MVKLTNTISTRFFKFFVFEHIIDNAEEGREMRERDEGEGQVTSDEARERDE
jgi:hypothetical protein